jgi:hypothetical protein
MELKNVVEMIMDYHLEQEWIILTVIILIIIRFWEEAHKKVEIIFVYIIGDIDDKTSKNLLRLFKLAIYITIIVFFVNIFFNDFNKMGEWGDFFGGVLNPLLTFLTFMGLLITIILQQKELQQSRKEFKGQKESLENQEFDNKFFQMLNLFNNIISTLKAEAFDPFQRNIITYQQREALQYIKTSLVSEVEEQKLITLKDFQQLFDRINNKYDTTYKFYFINLYQILKYIDKNSTEKKSLKEYSNIVRAQLSKDELVLLFYNAMGIRKYSQDNYKKLIEQYALFEHLRYNDLNETKNNKLVDSLLIEYSEGAFGKNIALKEKRTQIINKR